MSLANEIRRFAEENYIDPARARGEQQVSIRAGDVAKQMGLYSRLPAIVAALGTLKFQDGAGVELIGTKGPLMGSNSVLTFRIL